MPDIKTSSLRGAALAALLYASIGAGAAVSQEIVPFADPSRLVVIGGSLTEIVYALGEEGKLVARDTTAVYPPAVFQLPDVGYQRRLAPEGVLSVNPSALLVIEGSGPQETLDVLAETGIEYQTVPDVYSGEGIVARIRAVGTALDAGDKAETLIAGIEADLAALAERTADIESPARVLFILSFQDGALTVSGTGTAAHAAIGMAGAVNAVSEFVGYRPLTDEAVIAAAPDAVLVMQNAGAHNLTAEEVFTHAGLAQTPAGESRTFIAMDAGYLLGFGPRTPAAVSELSALLYDRD